MRLDERVWRYKSVTRHVRHELCGPDRDSVAELEGTAMEILVLLGILVAWFVLQMWILPKLGVST